MIGTVSQTKYGPVDKAVIAVKLWRPCKTATMTIFDAVGNVILDKMPFKKESDVKNLYYLWDGSNVHGMKVAVGTYLARIIVEDMEGKKFSTKINIGIKGKPGILR